MPVLHDWVEVRSIGEDGRAMLRVRRAGGRVPRTVRAVPGVSGRGGRAEPGPVRGDDEAAADADEGEGGGSGFEAAAETVGFGLCLDRGGDRLLMLRLRQRREQALRLSFRQRREQNG